MNVTLRFIVSIVGTLAIFFGVLAGAANASTVHRSAWEHVIERCHHSHNCRYITPGIRHDLRIGHRHARMFVGDTTVIYVEYSPNHVKKFVS